MLIAAILVIASAKVAVGVASDGSLLSLESNSKDADSLEEIKDMDSTQLKEKVGVLLAELRQKNEKEKQTTEGKKVKRDTVIADSKISAGDMDDTLGFTQLEDKVGSVDTMDGEEHSPKAEANIATLTFLENLRKLKEKEAQSKKEAEETKRTEETKSQRRLKKLKANGVSIQKLKEEGFSLEQLKREFTPKEVIEAGFSLAQLKEDGFTAKQVIESRTSFPASAIMSTYNLEKYYQLKTGTQQGGDHAKKVGMLVFAEGKVGVITDIRGAGFGPDDSYMCKISYSDGTTNKSMDNLGRLRFAAYSHYGAVQVVPVWKLKLN